MSHCPDHDSDGTPPPVVRRRDSTVASDPPTRCRRRGFVRSGSSVRVRRRRENDVGGKDRRRRGVVGGVRRRSTRSQSQKRPERRVRRRRAPLESLRPRNVRGVVVSTKRGRSEGWSDDGWTARRSHRIIRNGSRRRDGSTKNGGVRVPSLRGEGFSLSLSARFSFFHLHRSDDKFYRNSGHDRFQRRILHDDGPKTRRRQWRASEIISTTTTFPEG